MAQLHWFRFYVKDWLSSPAVARMLPEQRGAYITLLSLAWGDGDSEPSLPDEAAALAQLSGLGARWRRLGPLVRDQFVARDGQLYNAKLSAVWREGQERHEVFVERGRKGGKAKADKKAAATPSSTSSSTPSSTSSSTVPQGVVGAYQSGTGTGTAVKALTELLPAVAPDGAGPREAPGSAVAELQASKSEIAAAEVWLASRPDVAESIEAQIIELAPDIAGGDADDRKLTMASRRLLRPPLVVAARRDSAEPASSERQPSTDGPTAPHRAALDASTGPHRLSILPPTRRALAASRTNSP